MGAKIRDRHLETAGHSLVQLVHGLHSHVQWRASGTLCNHQPSVVDGEEMGIGTTDDGEGVGVVRVHIHS